MKYNSWCNDRPIKAILKELLGGKNGWNICQKSIQLDILENSLKPTFDYLKPLKLNMNPYLREIIKPSYILPRIPDLSQFITLKSRPDIICFKDNILIMIENKTRLFNKIQRDVWKKLSINEKIYFDHYFI
ncbi:hypothetical protein LCGC14_2658020, partial [marine sediment metagenome]